MEKNNWKTEKLQKLGTFDKGLGISKTDILAQGVPCIRYAEIYTKYDFLVKNCVSHISRQIAETSKPIIRGQLLFAGSGETVEDIGKCVAYLGNETAYASGDIIIFTFKTPNQNALFYSYYLNTVARRTLNKLGEGQSIVHIYADDLSKVLVPIVSLEEQRRIVEVLECWDKGIELVKKLIEQKELQKKGLLQNLVYNQPTCKNFYLGNLFSLGRGRVISKEEIQHNKGTYPVYSSQTSDNGILGYINSFDFEGEYLTWTTDGANAGKVFYRRGQFNCTNVCGTAKPHNSNLVNLYYVMSYLNKVTKRYVSYVGNPKLMNGVFSKIAIPLPEKTTQDWAATVLETADKEIDLLKQKLAKLEAQKKGLMQVLLTGKVRLK